MKPKSAKKVTVTAPLAALNRRSRKSETSSIGWLGGALDGTKATSSDPATAKPESVVSERPAVLGRLDDRLGQAAEHQRPRQPSPGRSSEGTEGSRDSGTTSVRRAAATSASGISAQKTLGQ